MLFLSEITIQHVQYEQQQHRSLTGQCDKRGKCGNGPNFLSSVACTKKIQHAISDMMEYVRVEYFYPVSWITIHLSTFTSFISKLHIRVRIWKRKGRAQMRLRENCRTPWVIRSMAYSQMKLVLPTPAPPDNTVSSPGRKPNRYLLRTGNRFHWKFSHRSSYREIGMFCAIRRRKISVEIMSSTERLKVILVA